MQTSRSNFFTITPGFCMLMAIFLLFLPLKWILGWSLAVLMHESSHLAALRLCRIKVQAVTLDISGAVIKTDAIPPLKEAICALAGPVGGAALILLRRLLPYTAVCAFLLSVYNMIPVYPLDGGRAVRCTVELFVPHYAETISSIVSNVTIGIILAVTATLTIYMDCGPIPIVAALLMVSKSHISKYSCKPKKQIVQ